MTTRHPEGLLTDYADDIRNKYIESGRHVSLWLHGNKERHIKERSSSTSVIPGKIIRKISTLEW